MRFEASRKGTEIAGQLVFFEFLYSLRDSVGCARLNLKIITLAVVFLGQLVLNWCSTGAELHPVADRG